MELIEKRPNVKLNVSVRLYICTKNKTTVKYTEMHYCLHFYNTGGKEMASALNVTVILKQNCIISLTATKAMVFNM